MFEDLENLKTALTSLKPMLNYSKGGAMLGHVLIQSAHGSLSVFATDGTDYVVNTFDTRLPDFQSSIAWPMAELVARLPTACHLSVGDRNGVAECLHIQSEPDLNGRRALNYSFDRINPALYPEIPVVGPGVTFKVNTVDFELAFKQIASYKHKKSKHPSLVGVLLEMECGKLYMQATNGHVLARRELQFTGDVEDCRAVVHASLGAYAMKARQINANSEITFRVDTKDPTRPKLSMDCGTFRVVQNCITTPAPLWNSLTDGTEANELATFNRPELLKQLEAMRVGRAKEAEIVVTGQPDGVIIYDEYSRGSADCISQSAQFGYAMELNTLIQAVKFMPGDKVTLSRNQRLDREESTKTIPSLSLTNGNSNHLFTIKKNLAPYLAFGSIQAYNEVNEAQNSGETTMDSATQTVSLTTKAIMISEDYWGMLAEARLAGVVTSKKNPKKAELVEMILEFNEAPLPAPEAAPAPAKPKSSPVKLQVLQGGVDAKPVALKAVGEIRPLKAGSLAAQMATYLFEHDELQLADYEQVGLDDKKYVRRIVSYLKEKGYSVARVGTAYRMELPEGMTEPLIA